MASGQLPQQSGVPGMNFSYNINEETTEIRCEINEDVTEEALDLENVENTAPVDNSVVEFDVEIFIEEIRQLPCLWNTSLAAYKDRNIKANAWKRLSVMFGKEGECLD